MRLLAGVARNYKKEIEFTRENRDTRAYAHDDSEYKFVFAGTAGSSAINPQRRRCLMVFLRVCVWVCMCTTYTNYATYASGESQKKRAIISLSLSLSFSAHEPLV